MNMKISDAEIKEALRLAQRYGILECCSAL